MPSQGESGRKEGEIAEPLPYRRRASLSNAVAEINVVDARERYDEAAADNGMREAGMFGIFNEGIEDNAIIVAWEEGDPENPYNWSKTRKNIITFANMINVINITMGSSLPSMAIDHICADFGVTSSPQRVLPISSYLVGFVFGPLIWGPLSEHFGRRRISVGTFVVFTIFTMACGFAPNWGSFLFFRLVVGIFAAAPIPIVAGFFADIFPDAGTRGWAMSAIMVTTLFGPLIAPILSGYTASTIGWRWAFWIAALFAAASLCLVGFLPETYAPVLLARRAARLRKLQAEALASSPSDPSAPPPPRILSPRDLEPEIHSVKHVVTVVLTRPLRMLAFEPIVSTSCVYLSLVYAIFYMSFQAFPIIFQSLYGLASGPAGLAFLPIGAGSILAFPVFWTYDVFLLRAQANPEAGTWTKREEFRRLPLACIGGPIFVVAMFWLGFSANPDSTAVIVPMLAGIPFGMGFVLIFMGILNYLTDAYDIFAASANAAASTSRSLLATVLPLATAPMFAKLGVSGACSLLGGLSAGMCLIPVVFIWKGQQIRARSRFCLALQERKAELARKEEERAIRRRRALARQTSDGVRPVGLDVPKEEV